MTQNKYQTLLAELLENQERLHDLNNILRGIELVFGKPTYRLEMHLPEIKELNTKIDVIIERQQYIMIVIETFFKDHIKEEEPRPRTSFEEHQAFYHVFGKFTLDYAQYFTIEERNQLDDMLIRVEKEYMSLKREHDRNGGRPTDE